MPELTPGWKTVQISQISDHCLGKMLDKKKNRGELKPYLRNLNVRWFDFDLSDVLQMRFEKDEADRYQAKKGDLIICEGGYPGRAAIWVSDEPIYLQKALHRVRVHQSVLPKWVLYWLYLKDMDGTLADSFSGTGIQHFTKAALARFGVPLPPLDVQKRIVAVLDQAFAALDRARAYAEDSLQDSNLLFKEILHRTIYGGFRRDQASFSKCSLTDALDVIRNGVNCDQKAGGRCKISRIESIATGSFNLDRVGYAELTESQMERARLLPGDILFSHINSVPHVGKTAVFDFDEDVYHGINLLLLRPSKGISSAYMSWFLKAVHATKYWERACKKSVNQASVNQKDIGKVPFFFPSKAEQSEVVQKLDDVSILVANARQSYIEKIADISNLRQSLLQKAFSGELT